MPVYSIPEITLSTYHDGTPVRAGDSVVPCMFVIDSNSKIATLIGDPITIPDISPPIISSYAVLQHVETYRFRPSAGTVKDDSSGLMKVYFLLTLQSAVTTSLQNIISSSCYSIMDNCWQLTGSMCATGSTWDANNMWTHCRQHVC